MEPDILPGFWRETLALRPDDEGEVVATLIERRCEALTHKAVLYVHGYVDYFFNTELADRYNAEGFDFYAIDLRKYGRSMLPHQSPNFVQSLDEYFEELDAAIHRIRNRDGHTFLLLNGHSTGGLIGALYADARREAETINAVFLNSPFFDLNGSWLNEHVVTNIASAVGTVLPNINFPSALSPLYAQSIHKDYRGEWDFRLDWKPIESFPIKAGFVHAIKMGQSKLQKGLQIAAPVLVMSSTESSRPKEWNDILYRTDSVLDVADIDRFSDTIGSDVTKIRIPGGIHDLVLSAKPVRENAYQKLFDWFRSRAFDEYPVATGKVFSIHFSQSPYE
ncbi:MAG TPA: alpha/beta hydrolase [Allocoleopsis sp.]